MIDPTVFRDDAVDPETPAGFAALRQALAGLMPPFPPETAHGYREGIRDVARTLGGGEIYRSSQARDRTLPGGPTLRVLEADEPRGVYLHVHGGGWVLGGADEQDAALEKLVAATGLTVVSVDYRLAPEAPFPAGLDDCEHAARWLADNALSEFGASWLAIGGESAGANLSLATLLRLRERPASLPFAAGNLLYGVYDLTLTPSQQQVTDSPVLPQELLLWFYEQYVPDPAQRRTPEVSPLYADLRGLPPLLLTVGTTDPLLDDSLFLFTRLLAAGVTADLHVLPGGDHAFDLLPLAISDRAFARIVAFLVPAAQPAARDRVVTA